MKNESGFKPLGRAVLTKPFEEEMSKVIAIPDSIRYSSAMLDQRVTVVAIGEAAWPDEPARAKPGDVVFVSKMSGYMAQSDKDGNLYRVVNDRDIFLGMEVNDE